MRRLRYQHPVFTHRSVSAQDRHESVLGPNRTYFCGAYWGYGFHEDGVELRAARRRPLRRRAVVTRHSCIYQGSVHHRRRTPVRARVPLPRVHALPRPRRARRGLRATGCCGRRRARPSRAGGAATTPATPRNHWTRWVRDLVAERTGSRPTGPVRLLTHRRYGGRGFNPISVYYCFDDRRRHPAVGGARGDQHAVARAHPPRARPARRRARPRRPASPRRCTCRRSCPCRSSTAGG